MDAETRNRWSEAKQKAYDWASDAQYATEGLVNSDDPVVGTMIDMANMWAAVAVALRPNP